MSRRPGRKRVEEEELAELRKKMRVTKEGKKRPMRSCGHCDRFITRYWHHEFCPYCGRVIE